MYYKILSAIIMLVISSLSMMSQSIDEIIEKSIEAQGGKAALGATSAIMKMTMNVMGMDMGMTMYMKKPSFRLEQNMMGQDMIMVFDGTNGWMKSPQGTQELTPEQLEQMKAQSDVNSMNLYAFKEKGYTIEKVGKEKIDGVTVFNLKITDKEGKVSNLYIDAEKYLAVKLTSDTEAGNAEILFVDYKKFDCILMPSKMTIKAGGMEMAMKIEDYKCNPKIDDSKFKKPE